MMCMVLFLFFFFKQKTAYEMRISDWSSDVCSSDLNCRSGVLAHTGQEQCLHDDGEHCTQTDQQRPRPESHAGPVHQWRCGSPGRGGLRSCDVELPGGVVRSFDALGTDSPTTSGDSADSRSHREAFPRWNTVDVGDPLETFRFAARAVAGSSEQNRQIGSNLGRFSPVRCCEPLWFYLRERFSAPTAGRSEFRCSGRLVVTQWTGNAFSARWLDGNRLSALAGAGRSEEHTSDLQSPMLISYAVFCLKNKTT